MKHIFDNIIYSDNIFNKYAISEENDILKTNIRATRESKYNIKLKLRKPSKKFKISSTMGIRRIFYTYLDPKTNNRNMIMGYPESNYNYRKSLKKLSRIRLILPYISNPHHISF